MMDLRRKIALFICPELAELPYDPALEISDKHTSLDPRAEANALIVRRLDRIYAAHTGIILDGQNAPDYIGPLDGWNDNANRVRWTVMGALERLRKGQQTGVRPTTAWRAQNYFSSIWPADLAWPSDIPRPAPNRKEVA
ncbi:hypothetical protein [Oceanicola sp. S124]|uniref:hypothetical protein n=1 Tax=Oceanicola sp. S124 TaxID=1042378 RepID=UPI00025582BC|nr:hypothetical protein [Oceanicola sp. S124]